MVVLNSKLGAPESFREVVYKDDVGSATNLPALLSEEDEIVYWRQELEQRFRQLFSVTSIKQATRRLESAKRCGQPNPFELSFMIGDIPYSFNLLDCFHPAPMLLPNLPKSEQIAPQADVSLSAPHIPASTMTLPESGPLEFAASALEDCSDELETFERQRRQNLSPRFPGVLRHGPLRGLSAAPVILLDRTAFFAPPQPRFPGILKQRSGQIPRIQLDHAVFAPERLSIPSATPDMLGMVPAVEPLLPPALKPARPAFHFSILSLHPTKPPVWRGLARTFGFLGIAAALISASISIKSD